MTTQEEDRGGDQRSAIALDQTGMAKLRTAIALDRTTLSWIRTTLTMATFGFGMIGFFRTLAERARTPQAELLHQAAIKFGTTLVIVGIIATVLSGVSHWLSLRRLRQNEPIAIHQWPLSITLAMLLSVLGLVGVWSLLSH
jgi:uncharacterized membrane protein YidH (DUF202 family)